MIYKKNLKLMGNRFEISVVSDNENWAYEKIDLAITEIQRIEKLLTTFSNESVTYQINENAGIQPVQVPKEVYDLIFRCQMLSKMTQGAFDISYGSIDKRFWNFDLNMKELPNKEEAKKAVELINYQNIKLNPNDSSVFLKLKGMRIGFGGIGKGYAAERAKIILKENGVTSGIVNAAGDLTTWGYQENGEAWTIGIADPNKKEALFSTFKITNTSVATSGNYEKFVLIGGKKYSHTIDPKTGYPITGIKSVTIIAENAEIADALATPVTVMGIEVGLDFINQLPNIGCIIIDDFDNIYHSKNIKIS
ncbi:Membrane-associated protein involved in thiamine biosynthesis [Flavobacterium indicum GPTSA100-9 = DSM 17447]|uniref:FAD:protein FMN transferase n=1 Tax=Flavobacterium indicum (strain DSM 17447 / CIP 109464 / GPTSA100-9) TaxID=1094466 RepID=H8XU70_FLAIG|nr:FAD:protein FMN transferase [Flavobacterium indicum]CCG52853.1 Membrane-associated protein involved in thiamine biosynthesis [Flavobacterium indicum GPTSA100-9 = DSM 17447]